MSGTGLEVSPDMNPEDVLAHYGKKGMRWGHTTTSDGGGGGVTAKSKASTNDIKDARDNITRQASDVKIAQRKAKRSGDKGSAERILADAKVSQMKSALLNNPDRITALKMTKGEKVIFGVIGVVGAGAGTGAVAGNVAARAVARRSIEKKQKSGAY